MSKRQSFYIQNDLIILLILFISVSLLSIYNAQQLEQYTPSETFVMKQLIWFLAGIFIVMVFQFFDLEQLYKASGVIYALSVLSLIVLRFSPESVAKTIKGAKSWFTFSPSFPLSLQPSEFTKIALILFLAAVISKHNKKYVKKTLTSDIYLLFKIGLFTLIPVIFTYIQPDLGTSLVFVFIAGVFVLLSGIDWKIIFAVLGGTIISAVLFVGLVVNFPEVSQETFGIKLHQVNRVLTWFDPTEQTADDRFHIDRSRLSLGSGQMYGKGINNLEVALPEAHTDFIFSIIGESFGFIGSAAVILLYFLLIYRLVIIGLKVFEFSDFGAYICFGFMALLLIHTFQNIGMTIGIMPITGIPLLLISYGGSSILSTMMGYGLVYRVAVEYSIQSDYLFK